MLYNEDEPVNSEASEIADRGYLITFEGIDGSGKTTQMSQLVSYLRASGKKVLTPREPGGTAIGEAVRRILLNKDHTNMRMETEMLLFAAARAQLVREIIGPALAAGVWVVCDRYMDSSLAYQGYGRGLSMEMIKVINAFAVDDYSPDLTFLLDLPVEVAAARLVARKSNLDRIDNEGLSFMQKTRNGYLALAAEEKRRIILLDAQKEQDVIEKQIRSCIEEGFGI